MSFLLTSCMGKAKNSYNSNSDISYSSEYIQYADDLTDYSEESTSYATDLTAFSNDLTAYSTEYTQIYFGEYDSDGIYSVQLQSEDYIKAYLEINGIHTIDLEKVITQLCIGTGTIIVTAFVLPALPVIAGVSTFTAASYTTQVCIMAIKISSDAVLGAALDAAISGTIKYYETNGDIEQTYYSAIEQSSQGFMWGAIISSAMETVKEVKFVHQALKEQKSIEESFVCEKRIEQLQGHLLNASLTKIKASPKVVGDNKQKYVYRVIRPDENPKIGLHPKNPGRNMTVEGHVLNGSKANFHGSQYISTTTDYNVAKAYAEQNGCRIVKIDLTKVPDNVNIYDLSTKVGQETYLKGVTSRNFANASKEVLLEGDIPAEAITVIK